MRNSWHRNADREIFMVCLEEENENDGQGA